MTLQSHLVTQMILQPINTQNLHVRLVGRIAATKSNGALSTYSQTIDQLKSVENAMAIIIQEYIPNANMSSILGTLNIHVPGVVSLINNNSSSVNDISSSRIPNDNGQERRLVNWSLIFC